MQNRKRYPSPNWGESRPSFSKNVCVCMLVSVCVCVCMLYAVFANIKKHVCVSWCVCVCFMVCLFVYSLGGADRVRWSRETETLLQRYEFCVCVCVCVFHGVFICLFTGGFETGGGEYIENGDET